MRWVIKRIGFHWSDGGIGKRGGREGIVYESPISASLTSYTVRVEGSNPSHSTRSLL